MSETHSCVFSAYCVKPYCDMACSKNAIYRMLASKSELNPNMAITTSTLDDILKYHNMIEQNIGKFIMVESCGVNKTSKDVADSITYTAICDMCEGHGSEITVYHLNYSKYIQMIKDSWTNGTTQKLQETQAFISNSKVLIISGMDFVSFKDMECQMLLTILHDRLQIDKISIVVVNRINDLHGNSVFFTQLKEALKGGKTA